MLQSCWWAVVGGLKWLAGAPVAGTANLHIAPGLKLAGMADIGRIDPCDIPMKKDSLLDLVRVACYNHQLDEAIELANLCLERGYEVSINLMAVAKNTLRKSTHASRRSRRPKSTCSTWRTRSGACTASRSGC